jgi:hypothetical protein
MAIGKDYSNPLIADDLLKIIWLLMYHGCSNLNIGYSRVNGFGKETSKSIKKFNDSPLTEVYTSGSDENSMKL